MAIAQEQQEAASLILKRLETQQAELSHTLSKARSAVDEMNKAGQASALIIEKVTRNAVEKAVQIALESFQLKAGATLADSVRPAVAALEGVTVRAERAEENLHHAASTISWKWVVVCGFTGSVLLSAIVGLSTLLVPSMKEIADLRANVADLEKRGGKVQLSKCGDKNRLCARIDPKAEKELQWGKNGQRWMILQGY